MSEAVCIEAVHKRYGPVRALEGVEFTIERGAFFGLLGPNGAGKSTLINIAAGLVRADSGHVTVMGHDVVRAYRRSRQVLGVVPQELVYDPFFSVREILRLQSGYFGFGRDNDVWVDELLSRLGLAHKADANLQTLSGGQKRRVLIAQALVHHPEVVVLDEPTAGVDVELRRTLWEFTRSLHERGHTIVLTTHYLQEAETLCERIAILHGGRLRALDTKSGLLARHPYRLLCLRVEDEGPTRLPGGIERLVVDRGDDQLTLRLHKLDDQVGSVLDALHRAGIRVRDLQTRDPGLEDVFLELTGEEAA
ncbi:MAG: ABC transporter ATP-binding protein [Gammaproteobacteria bacterium]|nr:ABC transporter ATP-binding protein [Gammaproteobacteria bacterium]